MDLKLLNNYIEEGWVISQRHPNYPLRIFNYSQSTQFERKWDDVTLSCRGLVLDESGNIIARPFKKFFNWEEVKDHPSIPAEQWIMPFEVFDKMDGSLGIIFYYANEWIIATRGSFVSDQAIKGKTLLDNYSMHKVSSEYTYLVEIIYPENRIVVDYYGESKLVLLGVIETATEKELSYETLQEISQLTGLPLVKRYDSLKNLEEIKALNWDNMEGMVIRYANGFRIKIKFEDYCALHRILTNCSSYDIWENLVKFGELPKELFDKVPDEFYDWVRETRDQLVANFNFISATAEREFKTILKSLSDVPDKEFSKIFALAIQNHKLKGLLFTLKKMSRKEGRGIVEEVVDGRILKRVETDEELQAKLKRGYDLAIWKMVKPDFEKPFKDKDN